MRLELDELLSRVRMAVDAAGKTEFFMGKQIRDDDIYNLPFTGRQKPSEPSRTPDTSPLGEANQ